MRRVVQENYRKFHAKKCDFNIWKVTSGREWTPTKSRSSLPKRSDRPAHRLSQPHWQAVQRGSSKLSDEFKRNSISVRTPGGRASARLSGRSLWVLPEVRRPRLRHACLHLRESSRPGQELRFSLRPDDLQQPIEREQMKSMLATGRTDLLTRLVSRRAAVQGVSGEESRRKIGFEFQPRKEKPADAKPAGANLRRRPQRKSRAKKRRRKPLG